MLRHGSPPCPNQSQAQGPKSNCRTAARRHSAGACRAQRYCATAACRWRHETVPLTPKAIRQIAHRYNSNGLNAALYDKQRPGAHEVLDDSQKQRIIAMVCSQAPEGRARWTVRLIVEEAVKRKLVPKVGRETIRVLLQSHELKPWREKNVVRGRVDPGIHRKDGRHAGHLREAL